MLPCSARALGTRNYLVLRCKDQPYPEKTTCSPIRRDVPPFYLHQILPPWYFQRHTLSRCTVGQVVLNNFGDKQASSHVKLMKVSLQNMFPSINVATVRLQDCRRVVMFNLDKANGTVEMRHYAVRATPTGITKAIKKVKRYAVDLGHPGLAFFTLDGLADEPSFVICKLYSSTYTGPLTCPHLISSAFGAVHVLRRCSLTAASTRVREIPMHITGASVKAIA